MQQGRIEDLESRITKLDRDHQAIMDELCHITDGYHRTSTHSASYIAAVSNINRIIRNSEDPADALHQAGYRRINLDVLVKWRDDFKKAGMERQSEQVQSLIDGLK